MRHPRDRGISRGTLVFGILPSSSLRSAVKDRGGRAWGDSAPRNKWAEIISLEPAGRTGWLFNCVYPLMSGQTDQRTGRCRRGAIARTKGFHPPTQPRQLFAVLHTTVVCVCLRCEDHGGKEVRWA